jgi:hypothetical protein
MGNLDVYKKLMKGSRRLSNEYINKLGKQIV